MLGGVADWALDGVPGNTNAQTLGKSSGLFGGVVTHLGGIPNDCFCTDIFYGSTHVR